jgi:hypothetical protein
MREKPEAASLPVCLRIGCGFKTKAGENAWRLPTHSAMRVGVRIFSQGEGAMGDSVCNWKRTGGPEANILAVKAVICDQKGVTAA